MHELPPLSPESEDELPSWSEAKKVSKTAKTQTKQKKGKSKTQTKQKKGKQTDVGEELPIISDEEVGEQIKVSKWSKTAASRADSAELKQNPDDELPGFWGDEPTIRATNSYEFTYSYPYARHMQQPRYYTTTARRAWYVLPLHFLHCGIRDG